MRCYICDRNDDLIHYDRVHQEYGPCTVCQAIIQETLEEFETEADTEDLFEVDHPGNGSDDRPHGPSIESIREGRRSQR